jgi:predicted patatin/cPLA2 family phospholipase
MNNSTDDFATPSACRVLSLDGGGAKGFYTLGVLKEIEAMIGVPLCDKFDLVYGTSTGAIIASLIALGYKIDDIHELYRDHVPRIMRTRTAAKKSEALEDLAKTIFKDSAFTDVKTGIGVVAARWLLEKPMIFKGSVAQAHGRHATFTPGFGCTIADAVIASCSAYPFFSRKTITTSNGDEIELIDGGYCANNPTLYAIADATIALKKSHSDLRVVSIGVGTYPEPTRRGLDWLFRQFWPVQLIQKTLSINTLSMEQLCAVLFKDIKMVRVNDTFERPEMATDLMEHNLKKLNLLYQRGSESYAKHEAQLKDFLN